MKLLVLFLLTNSLCGGAYAQTRYYKESSMVVGYKCPNDTYFNPDTKLCYPVNKEEVRSDERTTNATDSTSRNFRGGEVKVTINNYANGQTQMKMPEMNIEGDLAVKRRRELDKKAILSAVEKSLSGTWYEEEHTEALDDLVVHDEI